MQKVLRVTLALSVITWPKGEKIIRKRHLGGDGVGLLNKVSFGEVPLTLHKFLYIFGQKRYSFQLKKMVP